MISFQVCFKTLGEDEGGTIENASMITIIISLKEMILHEEVSEKRELSQMLINHELKSQKKMGIMDGEKVQTVGYLVTMVGQGKMEMQEVMIIMIMEISMEVIKN